MAFLNLPLELRCEVYDWLLPYDRLDANAIHFLIANSILHISSRSRREALAHYARTKELVISTVDSLPMIRILDGTFFEEVRKLRFRIDQLVALSKDAHGDVTLHISEGIGAVPIVSSVCQKLRTVKEINIDTVNLNLAAPAYRMKINLAGMLTRYCPPMAYVIVGGPLRQQRHMSDSREVTALRACEDAIRRGLQKRLAADPPVYSLATLERALAESESCADDRRSPAAPVNAAVSIG